MSNVKFLLDENVSSYIQNSFAQFAPDMALFVIGQSGAPPKSTLDPDILVWIEENDCLLVTNNRSSMPGHLMDHLTQGRHIPGILQLPRQMNVRAIVDDLLLIGGASYPGEFQDQIIHLPLRK